MVEIRAATYEDKDYDSCGNTTHAVIEINQMTIPLCAECLEELTQSLDVFNNTVFCYQCKLFKMSSSGWHYGGVCEKDGFDRDCMETCKNPER